MSGDGPGVAIVQWMRREPTKPTCAELTTPQSQQGHGRERRSLVPRQVDRGKFDTGAIPTSQQNLFLLTKPAIPLRLLPACMHFCGLLILLNCPN